MTATTDPTDRTTPRLAVTDRGTGGPALLLVPGWCGDRDVFDALVAGAAAHRRAVSVDLPGHGDSPMPDWDFGSGEVVDALVDLVERAGLDRVVPVALSHAGWAAIELRRRLGADRVPGLVLLDWMVLGPPPGFEDLLAGLRSPGWAEARSVLFGLWTEGVDVPALHEYVGRMAGHGAGMWGRAAREIGAAFAAHPVPLDAVDALGGCPTLHLYAQPSDEGFLAAQRAYAAEHPWFQVRRLDARSHFPMFEVPESMVEAVEAFVRTLR